MKILVCNRAEFRLQLWRDDPEWRLVREYECSVGAVGHDTPPGVYSISSRAKDPDWNVPDEEWAGELRGTVLKGDDPANPIKSRWLGLSDGVGIHGTDVLWGLGAAVSHGCVRLGIADVEDLFDRVALGTAVVVI